MNVVADRFGGAFDRWGVRYRSDWIAKQIGLRVGANAGMVRRIFKDIFFIGRERLLCSNMLVVDHRRLDWWERMKMGFEEIYCK
jgi:hypothetical protein